MGSALTDNLNIQVQYKLAEVYELHLKQLD